LLFQVIREISKSCRQGQRCDVAKSTNGSQLKNFGKLFYVRMKPFGFLPDWRSSGLAETEQAIANLDKLLGTKPAGDALSARLITVEFRIVHGNIERVASLGVNRQARAEHGLDLKPENAVKVAKEIQV